MKQKKRLLLAALFMFTVVCLHSVSVMADETETA